MQRTVDGPLSARARALVAAGPRPEVALPPRLRMAVLVAKANQVKHATCKRALQVRMSGVNGLVVRSCVVCKSSRVCDTNACVAALS